jgi:hypothetical protein
MGRAPLFGVHAAHCGTDGFKTLPERAHIQPNDTAFVLITQTVNLFTAKHKRYTAAAVMFQAAQLRTGAQKKSRQI